MAVVTATVSANKGALFLATCFSVSFIKSRWHRFYTVFQTSAFPKIQRSVTIAGKRAINTPCTTTIAANTPMLAATVQGERKMAA
jgi:hypothetical protein